MTNLISVCINFVLVGLLLAILPECKSAQTGQVVFALIFNLAAGITNVLVVASKLKQETKL